ncbi:Diguanylate cyclase [Lysobacter dokdonensis DS-58]|uniref:Diguanylate cyclase n=1 Tax=Lysobacter dokdonensis DS-58 TaxID=1300345 RepID=A0A0A2WJC6_9GAMM|nr:EAL domain-containing protein [Lysobacter dokdonensis]KGQ20276.1 Diguanylate cyclase [Lysobacter dokdonensis DS-58]
MDRRTQPLEVLMVEDSPADAELILRAMRDLGIPIRHRRVTSEHAMRMALAETRPDIILSDFSMPGFSGQEALQIAREVVAETPFIFVSGTIGEELAIEAVKRGADDYVLKDNLRRLPSAMDRAIRSAHERAERLRISAQLRESEERFRSIVESSLDWIWEIDRTGLIVYSNEAVRDILGYTAREVIGRNMLDLMSPISRAAAEALIPQYLVGSGRWRRRSMAFVHRDGSERMLLSNARSMHDDGQTVLGFRGTHHDDTERIKQDRKIRTLVRIHSVLSAFGTEVLRATDRKQVLDRACHVAVEQGGFRAAFIVERGQDDMLRFVARCGAPEVLAAILHADPMSLLDTDDPRAAYPGVRAIREARTIAMQDLSDPALPERLRATMEDAGVCSEVALPLGTPPWGAMLLFSATKQRTDDEEAELLGRLAGDIAYAADFIQKSERLEYLAYHNPITGLPNRAEFRERLPAMLQVVGPLAVAVLDVQGFGRINESRGRPYGDALLKEVGQALSRIDGGGLVAHPESDNFTVAWPAGADDLHAVSARLDAFLHQLGHTPFVVDGESVYITLSAGLALSPLHGNDGESLEQSALAALAEAKKRRARVLPFTEDLRGRAARRLELERDLRTAIERNQFALYYQPKFHTGTQRLLGAEALLRWVLPDGTIIGPVEFIPVLEETGLIVQVGRWVLKRALATATRWREKHPSIRIAVNLSARELRSADFIEAYAAILGPYAGEQPIDIEVTESLLMDDVERSTHLLDRLRELGCRVAIDDFGTGYSSLNYLARLPADEIKIDRSFVALLTESPETMGLVTNIITLAHSLSLQVVAEGVEEEDQAKLLRLLRCDAMQGYLFGRPMSEEEFARRFFN